MMMSRSFQCGYFRRITTGKTFLHPPTSQCTATITTNNNINSLRFMGRRRMIGSCSSSRLNGSRFRGGRMIIGGCSISMIGIGSYYYYYSSSFFNDHQDKLKALSTSAVTTTTTLCEASERPLQEGDESSGGDGDGGDMIVLMMGDDTKLMILNQLVKIQSQLYNTYRIVLRCMKLLVVFTPVMALYPIYYYYCYFGNTNENTNGTNLEARDAHEIVLGIATTNDDTSSTPSNRKRFIQYYYTVCLYCVELSGGATIIKFLQWMSSRPDLFGHAFCQVFCKLQDHTTPHHIHYTEQCMSESYGADWKESITLHEIIGSGCIGQVYRGTVKVASSGKDDSRDATTTNHESSSSPPQPQYQEVAIKVIHPNVRNDIDTDMDIIRHIITFVQYVNPGIQKHCQYLNINGVLDEFQKLLKLQMDLRYEARNLQRFQENFGHDPVIQFPQLLYHPSAADSSSSSSSMLLYPPNENVLIETFCDGIPILRYCRENHVSHRAQLNKLCYHGIRAVCQMIFLDNFVHGDLHPGNVYVSKDGTKFILFDVGIVNEYSYDDHAVLIDVLSAFIRKDGRKAGRCMIDDSNSKLMAATASSKMKADMAINEEQYIDKIEMLTIKASTEGYFMEQLGTYISYICDAASTHHVMMNPSFVTAALAVKIQEGIALAMDPNCSIPDVAIPIIIESERRRYMSDGTTTVTKHINSTVEYIKRSVFGDDKGVTKKE